MIHPDMATMLAFVATDAPIAAPLLARDRARGRRRLVQRRDRRRRHVDQRQLRDRRHRQGRASPPIARASDPRLAPMRAAIEDVRDRARAGDRARRRGRDQVHRDPRRRRARRRRMPARRVRHRAFAARQDRVLRVRSQPRPHRLRDRQHRGAGPRSRRASRSGSTTCSSSTTAGAPRAYREEDGQRVMKQDEITIRVDLGRGKAAATVWTCDFSHDYVSINADYRSPDDRSSPIARSRAPKACSRASRRCCRRPPRSRLEAASPRRAGASAPAAATCRRSRIRMRSRSTISSRSTSRSTSIDRNTRQFVAGLPANNVLLTGSRGTGKSSLVKAMLAKYARQGPAPDRGRQGRPRRPARHRASASRTAPNASSSSATT